MKMLDSAGQSGHPFVEKQVVERSLDTFVGVAQSSDACITEITQQPSHMASIMIMIDTEYAPSLV